MLYIKKISCDPTVDFAAEELKKYIRMMNPGRDVAIDNNDGGYRLGLMSDFGLDTSDCDNLALDDVIYLETKEGGGIIAGSNARSVLLAVYELLRKSGCRFLFPGIDGEYIPEGDLCSISLRHKPDLRFRGPCLEGSVSEESLIDMIDFIPKVGMNVFEFQFFLPIFFFRRYYCHWSSEVRANEHINERTVRRFVALAECEIKKRGLQYHAIGHGWTAAPFGIDVSSAWSPIDESSVPKENIQYLAMVNGKRGLFRGVPTNTEFCMSNPKAREIVVNYVVNFAKEHRYVDFLHFYLADGINNHCECPECSKKTVSDWLVILLNELDEAFTKEGLSTGIVFPVYTETTWAPIYERFKDVKRFVLMFAPISRSYTRTLGDTPNVVEFKRNDMTLPKDLATYIEMLRDWKKCYGGASLCFEYYFWLHQYFDVSTVALAKRAFYDIECYAKEGLDGLIGCGSTRSYFPNGFTYYVFALKQYDMSLSYEEIRDEYFTYAYGDLASRVYEYLEELGEVFGQGFMEGEDSLDRSISEYYNPKRADKLKTIKSVTDKARDIIRAAASPDERTVIHSLRLLGEHADIMDKLAEVIAIKASGDNEGAVVAFEKMRGEVSEREAYMDRHFDFGYFIEAIRRIIKGRQRDEAFGG